MMRERIWSIMPFAADEPYPDSGEELQAVGWGGMDSQNTRAAYTLQGARLPAVSLQHCRQQWSYAGAAESLIGDGQLCAGGRLQGQAFVGAKHGTGTHKFKPLTPLPLQACSHSRTSASATLGGPCCG